MESMLAHPVFLLLFVVVVGEFLGKVKLASFSLGSSAIIFVGLLLGHWGYIIPQGFQSFGLILFVYMIGLQAGPGFFSSFRSQGLKLTLGAVMIIFFGFVLTLTFSVMMDYTPGVSAGIFW